MKKEFDRELDDLLRECSRPQRRYPSTYAWDVFDIITSTYYGKQMYFLESSGTVYSRYSGTYFKDMNDALNEFLGLIGDDGGC